MSLLYVLLTSELLLLASAALPKANWGKCPIVRVKQDFELPEYMGIWYELQSENPVLEKGDRCVAAQYILDNFSGEVHVKNTAINAKNEAVNTTGTLKQVDTTKKEGKLSLKFENAPLSGPYWVVDTDYKSYTLVFSCVTILFVNIHTVRLLVRENVLNSQFMLDQVYSHAHQLMRDNNMDPSHLVDSDRTNCKH